MLHSDMYLLQFMIRLETRIRRIKIERRVYPSPHESISTDIIHL